MILNPVSFLDCFVFCIFLAVHLLRTVGLWRTLDHVIEGIPFLGRWDLLQLWVDVRTDFPVVTEVPKVILRHASFVLRLSNAPVDAFDRHATAFESLAVRCARYAHINLPPDILQAFFHKNVTYPFLKFRMLRHLYLWSPVHWEEYKDENTPPIVKGIWIKEDATKDPDIVVYYVHGKSAP